MWIVKLHQLSTMLYGFFRNLSKSVISSLSKSYICGSILNNCFSLSNEFGTNLFHSLVERKVKTENHLTTFEVVGVVNTEILKWVSLNFLFTNKLVNPNNLTFCFLGTFFWVPILVNRHEICSGCGPALTYFIGNQQKKKWVWSWDKIWAKLGPSNVVKKIKKLALSIGFFYILHGEYLLKHKVVGANTWVEI